MTILVADEYLVSRIGLKRIIENIHSNPAAMYEAGSIDDIKALLAVMRIEAIFIDSELFIRNNESLLKIINPNRNISVVATQVKNDSPEIEELLRLGVTQFIYRNASEEQITGVFNAILDSSTDQQAIKNKGEATDSFKLFSKREMEVLKLLCMGFTNKDIAQRLFISNKTVEWHKSSLIKKSSAKNINSVIIHAYRNRLFDNIYDNSLF